MSFAATYFEARQMFRAAAEAAGASLEVYSSAAAGPNGERLTTDVAALGLKTARRVLILQSGTHGVEGYCGSACQIAALRGDLSNHLPPGTGCLMIHAINPHGFAHDRRVTEGNVDLNRNFVDFAVPPPHNADYESLADAIAPSDLSDEVLAKANSSLRDFSAARGPASLQSAITRGQYQFPKGLYYGGSEPTWSRLTFEGILQRVPASCEKVLFIDFHTGLGPEAYGELISEDPPGAAAYQRAREWFGPSAKSTVSGESVSAQLVGTIDQAVAWALRGREVTALALEFGTQPGNQVFAALRADNWLYAYGDLKGDSAIEIKSAIRRAFYMETETWRTHVLERSGQVLRQALSALADKA